MRKLLRRMWYILRHRRVQADLAEEMAFHREMKERDLLAAGDTAIDARLGSRKALGSTALAHDEARDVWVWPWLQDIAQDIRFAARLLMKDPRFTLTAVLALALAIAVNNTIFTIINTMNFRDLPFDEPDRLVEIGTRDIRGREAGLSYLDFNDWRAASQTFIGMAATTGQAANLSDDAGAPERVGGAYVSANTFSLLRVRPILGRDFITDDERPGAQPVVILGYGLWQRRYGGERSILDRTIRVNDVASTVIGVMPADFRFPFSGEVWQPLSLAPAIREARRDARSLNVFGRLSDSQTIDQARGELSSIAARSAAEHSDTNKRIESRLEPMSGRQRVTGALLATMAGSVFFVLLIACTNVANLLLARSVARTREIAIRASLGATRWRIVRQLLIEAGLLATLAGIVGLALSVYGVRFLGAALNGRPFDAPASAAVTPYWANRSMNSTVFLFVGGLCLCTTLLSGLAPALHVSKANASAALKEGGRTGSVGVRARRWTSGFVVSQIALTLVLVTGAGLMLRTFVTLYGADRVIDTSGLVTARLSLPPQKYPTPESRRRFLERLDGRISATSLDVAVTSTIPFIRVNSSRGVLVEGQSEPLTGNAATALHVHADARYFDVLRVAMIRGRSFTAADARSGQEGVVVNQRFAEMFFSDRDALGHRIRLVNAGAADESDVWHTIVGVAPTIPQSVGSDDTAPPVVFVPLFGATTPSVVSLLARSRSDVASAVSQLREEVRALDPNLPLYYVQTLEEAFADARGALVLIGGWFGALAAIALVLATVGLYAITRHSITQRTQEIGVRVALGAEPRQVLWLFLRRTFVELSLGIAIGMAGALAIGQLLQTWIAGTSPRDALTLTAVTILLVIAAVSATLLPARRATRIDPIVALRYE